MAIVQGGTAPYAPPAAVTEIIRRFRDRGLSTPFTTEVLERAGIAASLSARTLQAFKLLDLIDSEGHPSEAFQELARLPEPEYKDRLQEIVAGAYSDVLRFADPATDNLERVRDAFRSYSPRGQQERMVTLFIGLCEFAGLDVSAASVARKRPDGTTKRSPSKPKPTQSRQARRADRDKAQPPTSAKDAALVAWFNTRPPTDEPWPSADRDSFMHTLRALIDGIYREHETTNETTNETDDEQ